MFFNSRGDQWNRIKVPEIKTCMFGQLIYNKGAMNMQWVRIVYSINGVGKIGQLHEEE